MRKLLRWMNRSPRSIGARTALPHGRAAHCSMAKIPDDAVITENRVMITSPGEPLRKRTLAFRGKPSPGEDCESAPAAGSSISSRAGDTFAFRRRGCRQMARVSYAELARDGDHHAFSVDYRVIGDFRHERVSAGREARAALAPIERGESVHQAQQFPH